MSSIQKIPSKCSPACFADQSHLQLWIPSASYLKKTARSPIWMLRTGNFETKSPEAWAESSSEQPSLRNTKNPVNVLKGREQEVPGLRWVTRLIKQPSPVTSETGGCSTDKDDHPPMLAQGEKDRKWRRKPRPSPPGAPDPFLRTLSPPPTRVLAGFSAGSGSLWARSLERGDAR